VARYLDTLVDLLLARRLLPSTANLRLDLKPKGRWALEIKRSLMREPIRRGRTRAYLTVLHSWVSTAFHESRSPALRRGLTSPP
jgi:hypothetical protein